VKPLILTDYRDASRFSAERFTPVPLAETERVRAVLTCFEPGQYIPVHEPAVDMALIVLEGEGQVVAGDQETLVGPGAIVLVPAGQARGIKASTRLVAAHLVAPPPGEQDHARVRAGLQQGRWR
jgi:quercetin dioxygenase-like cupin family protein